MSLQRKRTAVCLALSGFLLLSTGFTQNGAQPVKINVDGRVIETNTTTLSPERILSREGITLSDRDEYQITKTDRETEITVYRAVPVTVEFQGESREDLTSKPTVGEVLTELGYNLNDVEADLGFEAKVTDGSRIILTDSAAKIAEQERLAEEERQRALAAQKIETAQGELNYASALTMEASAYLPSDGGGSGITASGMMAQRGVAAVDPDVIPLGTRLYIPGYGEAIAADTGGAIIGHKIDLCMEDYGEAMQFGRRDITVYVLA